jgi:hypothetical protein
MAPAPRGTFRKGQVRLPEPKRTDTLKSVVTQSEATSPFELMADGLGIVLDQCGSVLR